MRIGDQAKDQERIAEPLEREAHRWIEQLVSGEATTDDAAALERWRQLSPAHESAFAQAARRWQDVGSAGRDLLAEGTAPLWSSRRRRITRRAMLGGAGTLAAAAAGYAMLEPPFGLWPSLRELTADYRTATGEQRRLNLADRVYVQMNTRTSLAIPAATGDADRIRLIAGEAAFATASESARPLMVLAGAGRTVASRARFDVRALDEVVRVTCLDGEVRVEQGGAAATIGAGRQLRYDRGGLGPVLAVDPAETASWQDGVLIFRLTPLSDVIAEINRYRPGRVVLLDRALAGRPINGRVRIDRIDDALGWIEQAVGATSRALPGGILLLS